MAKIFKLLQYSFHDQLRGTWLIGYTIFFIITGFGLLFFTTDVSKGVVSLMNIVVILIPLISSVMGAMHYYNAREFIELLLAQPIKRQHVFLGNYFGVAFSLSAAYLVGLGIPLLMHSIIYPVDTGSLGTLIITGVLLTFIFSALAYCIALSINDRMKGLGAVLALWLYMAVLYDGMFLLLLTLFRDYPLETPSIILTLLNPIDLSRLLIILKLDIAALMGFTGAVFQKFFGTMQGMFIASISLLTWMALPVAGIVLIAKRKDF